MKVASMERNRGNAQIFPSNKEKNRQSVSLNLAI
jgi:hypothetical protein